MQLNRFIEEVLSEEAVELLNTLIAHAIAVPPDSANGPPLYHLPVEQDIWNSTIRLMREIFEAEILISGDEEWLGFRLLQSFGVKEGQLAYQFTPIFAQTLMRH